MVFKRTSVKDRLFQLVSLRYLSFIFSRKKSFPEGLNGDSKSPIRVPHRKSEFKFQIGRVLFCRKKLSRKEESALNKRRKRNNRRKSRDDGKPERERERKRDFTVTRRLPDGNINFAKAGGKILIKHREQNAPLDTHN